MQKNPLDGADMVWVPEGDFLMGKQHWRYQEVSARKTQHTVFLDGYWIYKNEVTVAQYKKFCQATGRLLPKEPAWGWQDDYPIENIYWDDAAAYAQWAGASLPTEAQWEKAARGTDGRIYPWGNEWDANKTRCSNVESGDVKNPSPIGSFVADVSPYGCVDMAGNAFEWCENWWYDYKNISVKNPVGPATGY